MEYVGQALSIGVVLLGVAAILFGVGLVLWVVWQMRQSAHAARAERESDERWRAMVESLFPMLMSQVAELTRGRGRGDPRRARWPGAGETGGEWAAKPAEGG